MTESFKRLNWKNEVLTKSKARLIETGRSLKDKLESEKQKYVRPRHK